MDPDQTAPIDLGLHCLLESHPKHFNRRQKQTTFVVISVLSPNRTDFGDPGEGTRKRRRF